MVNPPAAAPTTAANQQQHQHQHPNALAPSSRDKYRLVPRVRQAVREDEIRVTNKGGVHRYVAYAARLFGEQEKKTVTIKATGNAICGAITLAEIVKRRFENLHQVNKIGVTTISDTYEPLEWGLDEITRQRNVPFLEIILGVDIEALDKEAPGYQEPIDQSLVKPMAMDQITAYRCRRKLYSYSKCEHLNVFLILTHSHSFIFECVHLCNTNRAFHVERN